MSLNVLQPGGRCRRLRAKGMFIEVERGPEADWLPSMSDGFVWCSHTQNCLGPDGGPAGYEECTPERGCFES